MEAGHGKINIIGTLVQTLVITILRLREAELRP
jgi:hypothetical protein